MSIRKRAWKSNGAEQTAWVVDYVDQHGKRRLKTFKLRKDAEAWSVNALHEVSHGIHAPNSKITVEEVVKLWIDHGRNEQPPLERSSLEQREQHLRLHIAPLLGREKLATLNTRRVNEFLDALRDSGRSRIMRRKVLTSLGCALKFAQGRGMVSQNVAGGITVKTDDRHNPKQKAEAGVNFPTKPQIKLLIDSAPPLWRPYILTAAFTALRASELRGLCWADVDLDGGGIRVRQRADKWCKMGPPKSAAGTRKVLLTPMVVNTLRQWKIACPPGELVFPNRCGNISNHANFLLRVWNPLLRQCGLPHFKFHNLRHVAVSLFIETLGWPPKRIQETVGHSSIKMTYDIYGHLFPEGRGDKEALKKVDAAIFVA
jgi:integrase